MAEPKSHPADQMIEFLNSLLAVDRVAVQELCSIRVLCNRALADHPTVQVLVGNERSSLMRPGETRVGLIGLLNGFYGVIEDGPRKGWGYILAHYDQGKLTHFERTELLPEGVGRWVELESATTPTERAKEE